MNSLKEYGVGDWGDSDGIGECEEIIRNAGGKVDNGMITLPIDTPETRANYLEACRAADYLCNEWDYSAKQGDTL